MSKPDLFIIESLGFDNEEDDFFEGKALRDILKFSDKKAIYYYIRTKKEFEEILKKFSNSSYRYLHISCHGNKNAMFTTLEKISFDELAKIINPFLKDRRVFFSACSMTNLDLAKRIINISGCYSVMGPKNAVPFDRAAIFWASFYHLMLRDSAQSMTKERIFDNATYVARLFGVPLNYYSGSKTKKIIKERRIGYK